MALTFHDGTHPLYKNYTVRPWNDVGLLMLNPERSQYDRWLMENYNTEARIRELCNGNGVRYCYPFGEGKSKLSEYIEAAEGSLILLKGLHQWERKDNGYDYRLHVTFGLEGQLWHLYANYYASSEKVVLSTVATAGERVTGEDHEGYTRAGGRRGKRS